MNEELAPDGERSGHKGAHLGSFAAEMGQSPGLVGRDADHQEALQGREEDVEGGHDDYGERS